MNRAREKGSGEMQRWFNILIMMFLCVCSSNAWAKTPVEKLNYVPGELLIVPKQGAMFQNNAAVNMSVLSSHKHGTPFIRVKLAQGSNVMAAAQTLANQSWVAHVQPNYIYKASALPNDPLFTQYWGLKNTGQTVNATTGIAGADISIEQAWNVVTNCSAVTVAVVDTGVNYNHPDLAANIWNNAAEIAGNGIDDDGNGFIDDVQGWDFVQSDNTPMDFNEHGTHVAGTIGAVGNNGVGGTGICWGVKIMPVRVLGSTGSGTTASVVAGIDYAVANGAKVINMSLGGGGGAPGDLQDIAIGNANAAGVLVVVAAGNSAANIDTTPTYPASYTQPNIISVAATDQNDALASFSNFGAVSVDVAAPGVNIKSTIPPARVNSNSWNFDTGAATGWTLETRDNFGTLLANTVAVSNEASFSPTFSLTDTPGGGLYTNNRSYRATSPAINLTGKQGALLSFQLNFITELGGDAVTSETSIDGGTTWVNHGGFWGNSGGWMSSKVDVGVLDGNAAALFRFRLDTNGSVVNDGVHIDDVAISTPGTVYNGSEYTFLNGTSMATPHVAGLAALIWAAEPALTHLQVRARILNTGDSLPSLPGKTATGTRINAQMAMPITAPSALATSVVSATRVNLSWTDTSVSESNFIVQRNTGAGFTTIATLPANTVAFLDTTAPSNSNMTYQIVAQSRDARTAISATASATTPVAPPAPVVASGGGGGSIGIWSIFALLSMLLLKTFSIRTKK